MKEMGDCILSFVAWCERNGITHQDVSMVFVFSDPTQINKAAKALVGELDAQDKRTINPSNANDWSYEGVKFGFALEEPLSKGDDPQAMMAILPIVGRN